MNDIMTPKRRFLAALHGGRVDRPSLGTVTSLANSEAMQRCGAAFPQAHLEVDRMVTLAAYVSLKAGFDMIFPVFSVVHEAAALGARIDWGDVNRMPSIEGIVWREHRDISIPEDFEQRPSMAVVLSALRQLKQQYGDRHAIIGKTFGPWSLGYHLFGVETILTMTIDAPDELSQILNGLMEITVRSARAQVLAGADALCLGDHCSRDMCSPDTYRRFLFPLHRRLAALIPCPVVLHTCGDTADRIDQFSQTGLSGFHFDTRVPAATARSLTGPNMALMGGVSNIHSLLHGDVSRIAADVKAACDAGVDIIGPECAIPLDTPMNGLKAIRTALEQLKRPA